MWSVPLYRLSRDYLYMISGLSTTRAVIYVISVLTCSYVWWTYQLLVKIILWVPYPIAVERGLRPLLNPPLHLTSLVFQPCLRACYVVTNGDRDLTRRYGNTVYHCPTSVTSSLPHPLIPPPSPSFLGSPVNFMYKVVK